MDFEVRVSEVLSTFQVRNVTLGNILVEISKWEIFVLPVFTIQQYNLTKPSLILLVTPLLFLLEQVRMSAVKETKGLFAEMSLITFYFIFREIFRKQ